MFANVADSAGVNHQTSGVSEQAIHWGDFDKDGYPDLFIGNLQTAGTSFFHRNNGNGTFTEAAATFGFQGPARGAQWVDYNNDGLWDLSIAGYAGATTAIPVKLFRNNGNGTFTDVATSAGITDAVISWGVTWADYDNNGYEDLFINAFGQSSSCLLYRNNGNGTFTNVTSEAGLSGLTQLSAIWGDYDQDGSMDLYTSGTGSTGNHLFKNNGDSTRRWVEINLLGGLVGGNNTFGVGAQIEIKAGALRMMREVNTGVGYRSQNMLTAHFGLGTNTIIDTLIIRWPAVPFTTLYTNLSTNQVLRLGEFPPLSVPASNHPEGFHLAQNYPNPFNPSTIINYSIARAERVTLEVVDILGRKIATLVDDQRSPGHYAVTWDAAKHASGIYLYRLNTGSATQTKKMMLFK